MRFVTIDPQPSLTAACIHTPPYNYKLVKVPFVPNCSHLKMNRNDKCRNWLNHHTYKIKNHLDIVSEYIPDDIDQIYIEGQFKGRAMIGIDYFMRGYFSLKYPNARVHTLSAKTWKTILDEGVQKGKSYYEEKMWEEIDTDNVFDLCPDELGNRNHDLVDVYCMMKYLLKN